jgi:Domain of unknown function (DUF4397)
MKNNRNFFLGCIVSATVALSSCGSDVYDATVPGAARVRLIHAVADSAAATVTAAVDGGNISFKPGLADPLAFGGTFPADSTYMRFVEGPHKFSVIPTGATTGLAADATLAANTYYSIFAVDSLPAIGALVVKDEIPPPVAGKIVIRFVNLSPNAPAYDLGVKGGEVLNGNVAYKTVSSFVQASLPVGNDTLKLETRAVGGTAAVRSLNIIKPVAGRVFTIISRGYVGTRAKSYAQSLVFTNNAR